MKKASVTNAEGVVMLVFSRKLGESVVVTGLPGNTCELKVSVMEIRGGRVRLGFESETNRGKERTEYWDQNGLTDLIPSDNDSDYSLFSNRFPDKDE